MNIYLKATKFVTVIVTTMALVGLLACGDDTPAPVNTGPSAEEIAKLVSDSVNASVSAAVAAAVPEGTSGEEIQRMVEAAVMASAQPGISRAEIEAAVQAATAAQLTAAEVQRIVDASIQAMPAPQIDASALRPLVQQAVAESVPEGVSAEQIAKLVEAAVGASTAGVPTREELAKSIQDAAQETAAGQLTAADVQKIVDASVAATAASVEQAAVMAAEKAAAAAVAAEQPGQEKVLRIRMANMPPGFNPHTGGSGAVTIVLGLTFSRLVQANPTTGTWAPDLAAAWEVNDDATAYTFHLHKNAVWHDGTPVTTRDVAYTVRSLLHPQSSEWMVNTYISVRGARAFQEGTATDVSGIEIIDEHTITLHMERPNSTFLDELNTIAALSPAPILPAHLLENIPDEQLFEHDFWSQQLVGSGPFKFVSWIPQQAMVLEANDDFYFGRPKIDRLILEIIPSNDATQIAMQRGEIDVTIRGGVPLAAQREFFQDPRFDVYATEAGLIVAYGWNQRKEDLRDPRLREAFWRAVDWDTINDRFYGGLNVVTDSPLVQPWVYKSEWNDRFSYNPDRSRELLREMSWDSNREIVLEMRPITNDDQRAELAVQQQMLADVGIKLAINEVDTAAGQSKWYDSHTADITGWAAGSMSDPNVFLTQNFGVDGEGENAFGVHHSRPDFWAAIQEGALIVDRDERAAFHQKFNEEFLWTILPLTSIRQPAQVKIKSKRFYMPIYGDVPKPANFSNMPVYPIHAGRDDNWIYHPEQWDIRE